LTIAVPVHDVLVPGPSKTFSMSLHDPVNATLTSSRATATIVAPTIAKCESCGVSCDDGDACTQDACSATLGCVHVNASATGTPYCQLAGGPDGTLCSANGSWIDSDGDGFSDAAEKQGYLDVNGNGRYDADTDVLLPDADPHRPDVYLHYDYTYANDHDHNPPAQSIQLMVDAFAAHGVTLHIDPKHNALCEHAGDPGCLTVGTGARVVTLGAPGTGLPDAACAGPSAVSPALVRTAIPYLERIKPAYHYMVFGHYASIPSDNGPYSCPSDPETPACAYLVSLPPQAGNLGTSEIGGDDAIVATQPFVDSASVPDIASIPVEWWAGLAMHELGHNLGLLHGGSDCFNQKPNYTSVMNYRFYLSGIPVARTPGEIVPASCQTDTDCPVTTHAMAAHCSALTHTCVRIDYSDRLFNNLDEANLDELLGLQGGVDDSDISFRHTGGSPQFTRVPTNGTPIDWNQDGALTAVVAAEVNGDGQLSVLSGQDDWAIATDSQGDTSFTQLKFKYQCDPNYGDF
jgi:hypothetical protein